MKLAKYHHHHHPYQLLISVPSHF